MDLSGLRTQQYYPMDKTSIPMNYSIEKDTSGKVMPTEMSAFELTPTSQHMYPNVIYPQNYTAYKNWAAELEYNRYIYASSIRQQMMVNAQNAAAAAAITPTYITTTTQPQRSKCSPVCDPTCPLNTPHTPHNTSPPKKQSSQGFRPLFPSKATPPVALVTPNQPKQSPASSPAFKDTSPPPPPPTPVVPIVPIEPAAKTSSQTVLTMKPPKKNAAARKLAPLETVEPEKPKKVAPTRQKPEKVSYFSEEDYIKEITRMAEYLTKISPKKDTNYPCGKLSCLAGKKDHENQPVHQMCCVVIEFLQYVQLYSFSLELIMNGLPRRQPYYKMFTHGQLEAKLKHSITTRWTYQTCDVRYNLTHDIFRRLLLFNSHMENLGLKDVIKENAKDVVPAKEVVPDVVPVKSDQKYLKNKESKIKCDSEDEYTKQHCPQDPDEPPPLKIDLGDEDIDEPPLKKVKTIELKTEVKTPEPELISCKKESDDEVSSLDSPINFKEECLDDFGDWEHGLTIDEYLQMNGNFMD